MIFGFGVVVVVVVGVADAVESASVVWKSSNCKRIERENTKKLLTMRIYEYMQIYSFYAQ